MKDHTDILAWASNCLVSKGYSLQHAPEILLETPWSNVIRFSTSNGFVYLKQTPPAIAIEPKIIQLLADQFHAHVPCVIAIDDERNCFLMKDAGQSLRHYLKTECRPDLLIQSVKLYTTLQRSTENQIESFLALGVPDWRLDKLPKLYDHLINEMELLKAESLTDKELQRLHDLKPNVLEQCELLSHYRIPETVVQPDFNSNNMLFDPNTQKMTWIDLGEIVITHPFFSLPNFLHQTTIHDGVKVDELIYHQLHDTYFENWLALATKNALLEAFSVIKTLLPLYSALAFYRLMLSVDAQALQSFYANRPNRLAGFLRAYLA